MEIVEVGNANVCSVVNCERTAAPRTIRQDACRTTQAMSPLPHPETRIPSRSHGPHVRLSRGGKALTGDFCLTGVSACARFLISASHRVGSSRSSNQKSDMAQQTAACILHPAQQHSRDMGRVARWLDRPQLRFNVSSQTEKHTRASDKICVSRSTSYHDEVASALIHRFPSPVH